MFIDPEIKAMGECHQALCEIDDDSKLRVIQWLVGKFSLNPNERHPNLRDSSSLTIDVKAHDEIDRELLGSTNKMLSVSAYESVADIFTKIDPQTECEKVLVVAAFLQIKNELSDIMSYDIQKELKHMGHEVANITKSISLLEEKKPKLMIQTRKEGKSKQAKKKYKVTMEGINSVIERLNSDMNETK